MITTRDGTADVRFIRSRRGRHHSEMARAASAASPAAAAARRRDRGGVAATASALLRRFGDPNDVAIASFVARVLVVLDALLSVAIVRRVAYTNIDWNAYMGEARGYASGERDYAKLRGDTGPLVYPAGFLYLYDALRRVTDDGADVRRAQMIFVVVYAAHQAAAMAVTVKARVVPPWALSLLCVSKRIHSVFALRMFNDGVCSLVAWVAIWLAQSKRFVAAAVALSVAASVKMNALLFLPPFLVLLVGHERVSTACVAVGAFVGVQVVVGWPFLSTYPREYVGRAFELGRKFTYEWTVNWKFVSIETFSSDAFSLGLLLAHVAILFAFAHARWYRRGGGFFPAFFVDFFERARTDAAASKRLKSLTAADVVCAMAEGNFIGIVFARSLHYQFYAWYFHSLPLLLWSISSNGSRRGGKGGGRLRRALAVAARVGAMGAIEWCWNVYPSTPTSSLVLFATHAALLLSLWLGGVGIPSGGRRRSRGGVKRARSKKKLW